MFNNSRMGTSNTLLMIRYEETGSFGRAPTTSQGVFVFAAILCARKPFPYSQKCFSRMMY